MRIAQLTDSEIAVIIDCLSQTRDRIRERLEGFANQDDATPNIDSALEKINSCMTPLTTDAVVVFNE